MIDRAKVKASAKQLLSKGGYWNFVLIGVIELAIAGLVSTIIPGIGTLLITGIIEVGISFAYLKAIRSERCDVADMFKNMGTNIANNILSAILVSIYTFLWSLLFFIPGLIKSISYSFTFFVLADNPIMSANDAIKESMRLTNGYKAELFVLTLSFFGWALLSGFTFGILAIFYVIPYMNITMAIYYDVIKMKQGASPYTKHEDIPAASDTEAFAE